MFISVRSKKSRLRQMMASSSERASVLFIRMRDSKDFETWLEVARCLGIWDGNSIQYEILKFQIEFSCNNNIIQIRFQE